MLGCALSESLGQLLAGNPGPRERIVLQSLIRGFAGSLSSVSASILDTLFCLDKIKFVKKLHHSTNNTGCISPMLSQ